MNKRSMPPQSAKQLTARNQKVAINKSSQSLQKLASAIEFSNEDTLSSLPHHSQACSSHSLLDLPSETSHVEHTDDSTLNLQDNEESQSAVPHNRKRSRTASSDRLRSPLKHRSYSLQSHNRNAYDLEYQLKKFSILDADNMVLIYCFLKYPKISFF